MFTQLLERVTDIATAPHGTSAFVAPLRPGWGAERTPRTRPGGSAPMVDQPAPAADGPGTPEVRFATSDVRAVSRGETVLELAEAEGLSPRFGCRRGVCRRCTRPKVSGQVRDLRTGELTGAGEERIQICVSVPETSVTIDL